MKLIDRIPIAIGMAIICAMAVLAGCSKSADTAEAKANSSHSPAAVSAAMPEQARTMAAQHAQGAEADAKKRAAAMAKSTPTNP